jgi:choline dehydrogenase-like flavoprotein
MRAHDATRAGLLRVFAESPFAKLRTGFAALKRLALFLCYAESDPDAPAGAQNPTWARIGYPGPRGDRGARDPALPLRRALDGERVRADVVVIGSGAGGGTAAAAFARAGKRVVVLEAGGAYDAASFDQRERSMASLYLDGGLTASDDLSVAILAGATLGGGTTVNWCTSFRLPDAIAAEWARESRIQNLGAELAPHYAALERELAIAPVVEHNRNNAVLLEGARALGLHADAMPRNAPPDCGEGCGYCGFGCAYGKKRSTARAFLPDVALADGAIYADARAERIALEGSRAREVRVAQRVDAETVRSFTVEADLVIVAAGTLRTPGLLARSGVRHPLLGQRLFLHPVAAALAEYEAPIEPWRGPMQSAYSDAAAYADGNYGAKIEVAPTHPGLAALAVPWENRERHARAMDRAGRTAAFIAVTRDRDPGEIGLDDEARIRYRVSPFDGEHLLAGLATIADLAFAGGATRVTTLHSTPIVLEAARWDADARAAFVARLARLGVSPNRQIVFSAHQMGTAALGADPERAVVDPDGRVWGYDNLVVADASLFPQASGVNPMLTIMALARRVAERHGGDVTARDPSVFAQVIE